MATARVPGRRVIQTESGNFPTDVYVAGGLASLTGHEVRVDDLSTIKDDVAVVAGDRGQLPHGRQARHARTHRRGRKRRAPLIIWDLCHSAGAFPSTSRVPAPTMRSAAATNISTADRGRLLSRMSRHGISRDFDATQRVARATPHPSLSRRTINPQMALMLCASGRRR